MSAVSHDPFAAAAGVADAVLYEGYVLYPYRASSRKNQLRWQFGVLCPRAFAEADASERWWTRTECLLEPGAAPRLAVRLRFLQLQRRTVRRGGPEDRGAGEAAGVGAGGLEVEGERYVSFDEAVEVVVDLPAVGLSPAWAPEAVASGQRVPFELEQRFSCGSGTLEEPILDRAGQVVGSIARTRRQLEGRVLLSASIVEPGGPLLRVGVRVENLTSWDLDPAARRDDVLDCSLISVHTLLAANDARFLSLFDPPAAAGEAAAGCRNEGSFPVLVGAEDAVVLSSPIILSDHPAIAPESGGDLYDATEIDEILALRVLALTEEEKAEARGTDPRAAAIIDLCESMSPESWAQLHGALR